MTLPKRKKKSQPFALLGGFCMALLGITASDSSENTYTCGLYRTVCSTVPLVTVGRWVPTLSLPFKI